MEQLRSLPARLLKFRFVRFCITGGLNTAVDFLVFFLLSYFTSVSTVLLVVVAAICGIVKGGVRHE